MRDLRPIALRETPSAFHLSGSTWEFGVSRANGLIERAVVRGDSWLASPVPDLWASGAVDPRGDAYHARHARDASVRLLSAEPERVVLESEGGFARVDGGALPLAWGLRYTFDADGTVQVDVRVEARGDMVLRWLSLGRGQVDPAACRFLAHEGDSAANSATCRPVCHSLDAGDFDSGGRFLPWVHFGNDRSGLEVVFLHSDRAAAGWTDTCPYPTGDPLGHAGDLVVVRVEGGRPSWEAFGLRNLREPVDEGWSWADTFFLSAVPGKEAAPAANDLRVWWLGPHQYHSGWCCPDEERVAAWAASGANTVIGGVNWRSGDYSHPDCPGEVERLIEACHRHGMRVLPYVTFTDMEFGAPAFAAHGREWRMEPVAEFNYRTHLMCYGAEGWQEHWEREVTAAWESLPFDGLYIDFWAGRLICRNADHGCIGPHGRHNAAGLRRMARFARRLVDQREGLIVANTNILPLAMLGNCFDVRLLGEWANPEETDPLVSRIFDNAHRFGGANLLLTGQVPGITRRTLAIAEVFQGTPVLSGGRTPEERELLSARARLSASFGVERAAARNAFEMPPSPLLEGVQVSTYARSDNGEFLVTLSRLESEPVNVPLGALAEVRGFPAGRSLIYSVEAGEVLGGRALDADGLAEATLEVPGESLHTLWLRPDPGVPCLLAALSGRERPAAEWDAVARTLSFTVAHPSLASAEVTLAGPAPDSLVAGDQGVEFVAGTGCVRAQVPCNVLIVARYPEPRLPQLRMRFTRFDALPDADVPEGYQIRHYQPGDEAGWAAVLSSTGDLGPWDAERVVRLLNGDRHAVPEGSFLATWHGMPVACACMVVGPGGHEPEVGWVAAMPEHRGRRLAYHVCLAVLRFMRDRGVGDAYLLSDDSRTPAIKTYLRLGFEPQVSDASHPARWQRILSELAAGRS